jgi:putative ABC transport system permease protein
VGAVLSIGIAGSVSVAAVAYAGLFRPLPFPDAGRLVTIRQVFTPSGYEPATGLADFDDWSQRLSTAASLVGSSTYALVVTDSGAPTAIEGSDVVGPFFSVMGIRPEAGRGLDEADPAGTCVLSHRLAVQIAGSATGAVGRTLATSLGELTVVGVMPRAFSMLANNVDLWTNGRASASPQVRAATGAPSYSRVARLGPGTTVAAFRARARAVLDDLTPENQHGNWQIVVRPLRAALLGDAHPTLVIFLIAAGLILLVAGTNAAMLIANRTLASAPDVAIRLALGATPGGVARIRLWETVILIAGASAAGWLTGTAAVRAFGRVAAFGLPTVATAGAAGVVGVGALVAGVIVALVCAGIELLTLRSSRMAASLRAPTSTPPRAGRRLRSALVVSQLATATVLLTGTGLLGRTLLALHAADIGLDGTDHVLTMSVPVRESTLDRDAPSQSAMMTALLEQIQALPGVQAAAMSGALPPASSQILFTVHYENGRESRTTRIDVVSGTPGYLTALGARLVFGRLFRPSDTTGGEPVAVVSQLALRHLGLSQSDLERPLNMALPTISRGRVRPRLVGVIQDIRYTGLDAPMTGGVYVLASQIAMRLPHLVVRTSGDPLALAPAVTRLVRTADRSLPLPTPERLDRVVDATLSPRAARFGLVGLFAMAAVVLALVGLIAALVRSVVERQRELAIRSAVGATPERLVRSVLARGVGLAGTGAGAGMVVALACGRLLAGAVYGVTPYDPATCVSAVALVLGLALLGSYLPARRAAASDPVTLLRSP